MNFKMEGWKPNVGYDVLEFGDQFERVTAQIGDLEFIEELSDELEDVFIQETTDILIGFNTDGLSHANFGSEFIYHGANLIGEEISDVLKKFPELSGGEREPEIVLKNGQIDRAYMKDELGIFLTMDEHNIVRAVMIFRDEPAA